MMTIIMMSFAISMAWIVFNKGLYKGAAPVVIAKIMKRVVAISNLIVKTKEDGEEENEIPGNAEDHSRQGIDEACSGLCCSTILK